MTTEQYQHIINKFRLYYNRVISKELQKLEKRRKRLMYFFIFSIVLFFILAILLIEAKVNALTLFALIPVTAYSIFIYYRIKYFKSIFKPAIVRLILDFIDTEIEAGNDRRLLEIEQRIQSYNMKIKELEEIISRTKQKLYFKIEQRIEDIARNIESGIEQDVIDVVKERVVLLDAELKDLKQKIAHAKANPDRDSENRIADMEAERLIVERKLRNIKLSLEDGLEEQISAAEREIRNLKSRNTVFKKRMGEHLKAKLHYKFDSKIPKETFDNSGIFNIKPSLYEGEDFISGYIGTATFEMSELNVMRLSPVRALLETVFRGIFFKANFYYDTGGLVVFIPKEERQELSETIRGITSKGGRRIHATSPEFDELFVAYASADVDVNSLLSQEAFKAIMDYKKRLNKKIYISFNKGYVYIAVTETKDILEPKILKSNADYKLVREFFEDILLIIAIVEDFDLNH
jgi:Ca2+/Na+ antiporter